MRIAEMANDVGEWVERAPKWGGGETFRGINVGESVAATYKSVAIIDVNHGTASWSTTQAVSLAFSSHGEGQRVVFRSPTQPKGTSIKHVWCFQKEDEVLVSKTSRYKVVSTMRSDGIPFVDVREA